MTTVTTQTAKPLPFHGGTCYACNATATGLRDRRPEGGSLEPACDRHREPTIRTYEACIFCDGVVRKGSTEIDGRFVHAKCAKAEAES